MIIYILAKRLAQDYYINIQLVKITRSKRVKDAWIQKPGHFFWKRRLR